MTTPMLFITGTELLAILGISLIITLFSVIIISIVSLIEQRLSKNRKDALEVTIMEGNKKKGKLEFDVKDSSEYIAEQTNIAIKKLNLSEKISIRMAQVRIPISAPVKSEFLFQTT